MEEGIGSAEVNLPCRL